MSIRGDRGPRDQMAMPAEPSNKRESGYRRTGRYGRGPGDQRRYDRYGDSGGGLGGLLKFLLFLVVLAGLVLVALVTVARPIARLAVVALAEDNPSALKIGFVADLVREDIGDPSPRRPRAPATRSCSPSRPATRRRPSRPSCSRRA